MLLIDTTNVTIPENSEVGKIFNIASATLNPNSKYLIIGFCVSLSNYPDIIMSCGIMVDPLLENPNLFYANGGKLQEQLCLTVEDFIVLDIMKLMMKK